MEIIILKTILLILCLFGILAVIVFFKRKNSEENNITFLIQKLEHQKSLDLKIIEKRNKEITKLEQEILKCKKKLNMKLFEK